MGVQGLWQLLQSVGHPVTLESLEGKTLAVDVSLWLHQSVKGMRDRHGNSVPNAHLISLFNKVCKLLFYRVKPVFVFDGGVPALKMRTLSARRNRRDQAELQSSRASQKLLTTLMTQHAVQHVRGEASGEGSNQATMGSKVTSSASHERDMFDLPPLPEDSRIREGGENDDSMPGPVWDHLLHSQYQCLDDVDIEGEEFLSLPAEMKHELLTEIKERTKFNSWTHINDMPEDGMDFSKFQMSRLMKKSKLSAKIDNVRKELNEQNQGQITLDITREHGSGNVEARRVMSEEGSHIFLIKRRQDNFMSTSQKTDSLDDSGNVRDENNCNVISNADDRSQFEEIQVIDRVPDYSSTVDALLDGNSDNESDHTEKIILSDNALCSNKPLTDVIIHIKSAPGSENNVDGDLNKCVEIIGMNSNSREIQTGKANLQGNLTLSSHSDSGINHLKNKSSLEISNVDSSDRITGEYNDDDSVLVPETLKDDSSVIVSKSTGQNLSGTCYSTCTAATNNTVPDKQDCEIDREKLSVCVNTLDTANLNSSTPCEYLGKRVIGKDDKNDELDEVSGEKKVKLSTTEHVIVPGGNSIHAVSQAEQHKGQIAGHIEVITPDDDGNDRIVVKDDERDSGQESDSDADDFIDIPCDIASTQPSAFIPATMATDHIHSLEIIVTEAMPTSSDNSSISREGQKDVLLDRDESAIVLDNVSDDKVNEERNEEQMTTRNEEQMTTPTLTQEDLSNFQEELEEESRTLQSEKGKQKRMAASITDQMYTEAQELLQLFGLPYLVSPMEAEAQCAFLDQAKQTDGTITDDSDIWLFGGTRTYKNVFNQARHVELFRSQDVTNKFGLDREQLIHIALLCGSDYTEGVEGIGPVTAMEILAEFPGGCLEGLKAFRVWWDEAQNQRVAPQETKVKGKLRTLSLPQGFPSSEVVDAYLKPVVDDSMERFSWGTPDLGLLREFAQEKLGWTRDKVDEVLLPVMKQLNKTQTQNRITAYFPQDISDEIPQNIKSQRVKNVLRRLNNKQGDNNSPSKVAKVTDERMTKTASKYQKTKTKGRETDMDVQDNCEMSQGGSKVTNTKKKCGAKMRRAKTVKKQDSLNEDKTSKTKRQKPTKTNASLPKIITPATRRGKKSRGKGRSSAIKAASRIQESLNLSESSSENSDSECKLSNLDIEQLLEPYSDGDE